MTEYVKHESSKGYHLCQLYWTLTGGDIGTNALRNAHTKTSQLRNAIIRFKPNFAHYSFCNSTMSNLIIEAGN